MDRSGVTVRRIPVAIAVLAGAIMALNVIPVAAAGSERNEINLRVLELTNAERQNAGLAPLALNPQLSDAALKYSEVLASGSCFEHSCGAVPDFADRLGQVGYTGWAAIAENIAAGYPTPDAVVAGWMASEGHRANILSPNYREIGIGMVTGGSFGTYWTQEFGSRPDDQGAEPAE